MKISIWVFSYLSIYLSIYSFPSIYMTVFIPLICLTLISGHSFVLKVSNLIPQDNAVKAKTRQHSHKKTSKFSKLDKATWHLQAAIAAADTTLSCHQAWVLTSSKRQPYTYGFAAKIQDFRGFSFLFFSLSDFLYSFKRILVSFELHLFTCWNSFLYFFFYVKSGFSYLSFYV